MKKLLILAWTLSLCLCNGGAHAQQYEEKQNVSNPQYFKNAGFENKTAGWTVGAGTRSYPTSIGDKISGQGFKLAFTSINGTLLSQTYSDCADLNGKNLLAGIHIKTPSANIEVCSQVDGTDYQCVAVASGGSKLEWTPVTMVAGPHTCGMRVKTTSSTTSDITVDAARLEENRVVGSATVVTPWVSYTPTLTGLTLGNGSLEGFWRRVGDSIEVRIKHIMGSTGTTSAQFQWGLPAGITLDSAKYNVTGGAGTRPGVSTFWYDVSAPQFKNIVSYPFSSTTIAVSIQGTANQLSNSEVASGQTDAVNIWLTAPVVGWDANANVVEYPAANILGTVFIEPNSATCRAGSVKLDGSTLSGSQYAALIAYNGTAVLKDWSAMSPRGTGTQSVSGRTKTGPTLGAVQEDQMQGHRHDEIAPRYAGGSGLSGSQGQFGHVDGGIAPNQPWISSPTSDGSNGTPRTGSETRGNSIGVTWCQWYVSQASQLIRQSVVYDTVVKAEGIDGVTSQEEGVFTPTLTNASNLTSSSVIQCDYERLGKRVKGGCYVNAACSGTSVLAHLRFTLPIAPGSNWTNTNQVRGFTNSFDNPGWSTGTVESTNAAQTASAYWTCSTTSSKARVIEFSYRLP